MPLIFLVAMSWSSLRAQESVGSIRGTVIDKDFDAVVAGAKIVILGQPSAGTTTPAISSEEGNFVFSRIPPGSYTLRVTKSGYLEQTKRVVVRSGQVTEQDFALLADYTVMDEFVVEDLFDFGGGSEQGLLELRFKSPSLMDSISAEFMKRSGASDAASALRLVSGATVADGKSAVIRGLPDRYVSSQMNGVRLPTADENKRAVELDQFPAVVVESVQVRKTFTPDQQGDASGGAVDVRLKGIPEQPFFVRWSAQTTYNSQVTGRSTFLSYDGGGVSAMGRDDGRRDMQLDRLGENWEGAAGVSRQQAPTDLKLNGSIGGMHEFDSGTKLGAFGTLFYERDSSFYDNGIDDSLWVEKAGANLTPRTFQGTAADGDFRTGLFDVTRGTQSVEWGGLATIGVETENHLLNILYLKTRGAEDKATLAQDTRGKQHFFPGHDPKDPSSPGFGDDLDGAKYLRLETLDYTERTTDTLQFRGRHGFGSRGDGLFGAPELEWTYALSSANFDQPDKRQFGSEWTPGYSIGSFKVPDLHGQYKPGANFTLGNFQRIWKEIDEKSEQYRVDLELPFKQWSETEGYLEIGWFKDSVRREFDQDSFSNFSDNSTWSGPFGQYWSSVFRYEDHPITASEQDVDYTGHIDIDAYYAMFDLPLTSWLKLVGGLRVERTAIDVVNDPEKDALWYPKGAADGVQLNPGDADVQIAQHDQLPAIAMVMDATDALTFRASYSQTIARQTFKELTPILQQEFLGGPIFIGNPELQISELENYDLRVDYTVYDGGLFSVSWFKKDIDDPIEYVQRIASSFDYTTAVNYPDGELEGWEFETRHQLGHFWEALDGLSIGANATFIDGKVSLPQSERDELDALKVPQASRDMTNAPERLLNLFATYDLERTNSQFAVFYTLTGDTLIAGPGQSKSNFIPSIYAKEFETVNASFIQKLSDHVSLKIQAKNLTNPRIDTVYRSDYINGDATRTSFTRGVDYSITLSGEIRF